MHRKQPLKLFLKKDVFLKIAALTVGRWICSQNTWKIPIKRFIFCKVASFWPATLLKMNFVIGIVQGFGWKFQNTYFPEQLSVAASGIKTNNFITSETFTCMAVYMYGCSDACMLHFHKLPWFDLGHQPDERYFKLFYRITYWALLLLVVLGSQGKSNDIFLFLFFTYLFFL